MQYLQITDINEMINIITTLKDYEPLPTSNESPNLNDKTNNLIITKTANILHAFVPLLTSRVYKKYELQLRQAIASATLSASINNSKESSLAKDVKNLLDK